MLFWACMLLAVAVNAGPVTREQAKQIAAAFMSTKSGMHRAPSVSALRVQPVLKAVDESGQPYLYAVSSGEQDGFVLVCGDDRMRSVLGYSKKGDFVEEDLPPHLRAWLQGYVDEMKLLDSLGYAPSTPACHRATSVKTAISPLVTTQWSQTAPYNNKCPQFFSYGPSVTGCAATAMAQVLYHAAKVGGLTSTHLTKQIDAYTCDRKWAGKGQIKVDAIPAETQIDWSAMRDTYTAQDTDAGAAAVATLMHCCGASLHMDYADAENGGSIASISSVPVGLSYFDGFASTAQLVSRTSYSYSGWIDLMYSELQAGRPVCFRGQSTGGGHAFVLDGYDGDDLFHVNWGWGGNSDNYYALSVLDPKNTTGTGASSSNDGYSMQQRAVIGIQAGSGGSIPLHMTMGDFSVKGQEVSFSAFNKTGFTQEFDFSIGIYDNGNIIQIGEILTNDFPNEQGYNSTTFTVPTNSDYANSTKRIVPISRECSSEEWLTDGDPLTYYFSAEYDGKGVPTLTAHPIPNLSASISVSSSGYKSETQQVNVTVTNSGEEFCGPLYLFVSSNKLTTGSKEYSGGITVVGGKSQTVVFEWTPTVIGTYYLNIATDEKGSHIIGTGSATIHTRGLSGNSCMMSALEVTGADESSTETDSDGNITMDVYSTTICAAPTLLNITEGTLTKIRPKFCLYRFDGSTWVDTGKSFTDPKECEIEAGEKVSYAPITFGQNLAYGKYKIVLKILGIAVDSRWILNLVEGYSAVNETGQHVMVKITDNTIAVADGMAAVDFSAVDLSGMTITPGSNPNTLYVFGDGQEVPASLDGRNVVQNGVARQITLTDDGGSFAASVDFTADKISYSRTFDQSYTYGVGWTTLVLPFDATKVSDGSRDLSWDEQNDDVLIMEFVGEEDAKLLFSAVKDATVLKAHTPFLIALPGGDAAHATQADSRKLTFSAEHVVVAAMAKASVTGSNYKMVGTTCNTGSLEDIYTLNAEGDRFTNGTAAVSPFRAYFTNTVTGLRRSELLIGFSGEPTGMVQIESKGNENADAAWYTLDGRRLQGKPTEKGLYLQNGRKWVVR